MGPFSVRGVNNVPAILANGVGDPMEHLSHRGGGGGLQLDAGWIVIIVCGVAFAIYLFWQFGPKPILASAAMATATHTPEWYTPTPSITSTAIVTSTATQTRTALPTGIISGKPQIQTGPNYGLPNLVADLTAVSVYTSPLPATVQVSVTRQVEVTRLVVVTATPEPPTPTATPTLTATATETAAEGPTATRATTATATYTPTLTATYTPTLADTAAITITQTVTATVGP